MMWNWPLSRWRPERLSYFGDGPVIGPETLWEIVAGRRVTQFGTSPAYLALCQEFGYAPGKALDLAPLAQRDVDRLDPARPPV
jgi:acetoacetyl-CoA synthetase